MTLEKCVNYIAKVHRLDFNHGEGGLVPQEENPCHYCCGYVSSCNFYSPERGIHNLDNDSEAEE